jgi:hypothetical protein
MFSNLHNRSKDLGSPHKSGITKDGEFKGAQILDIVLRKWFPMDPSFQVPNSKEDDELNENSPTKVRRRNLLLGINTQSQGAPMDMDESPNLVHLIGETSHPQASKLEPKLETILSVLKS